MSTIFEENIKDFQPISLTDLNATASFLKRIDKKYLLNSTEFSEVIKDLNSEFKVLEIDGKKVFSYDNIYMDTPDYLFYNQHQNKQDSRTKVRTRFYVDSDLAFFEYKHKLDGVTKKYRYKFPSSEHGLMTKWKKRFYEWVWQSVYDSWDAPDISPSIKTNYKRITMVSRDWEERLTIDFDIKATDLRKESPEIVDLKKLVIIESKSLKNDSIAGKIMKENNIEKATSCSKYALWIVYSGLAEKFDTFKETMEKIREIRMETVRAVKRTSSLEKVNERFTKKIIKKENVL